MNRNKDDQIAYVDPVRDGPHRHLQVQSSESPAQRALIKNIESENESLREQVRALREELDRQESQKDHLRRRLEELESSNEQLFCQYLELQRQNNNLANLYVASDRLHGTMNRQEGLEIIQEIIINLIGSEELAIFELEERGSRLSLMSSVGIDQGKYQTIPVGSGLIGCTVRSGESYLAGRTNIEIDCSDELDLSACVPLRLDGKVRGVIAIFHLLQQKNGFETADYELLDLLANQAAIAIYGTGLAGRAGAEVGS